MYVGQERCTEEKCYIQKNVNVTKSLWTISRVNMEQISEMEIHGTLTCLIN